MIFDLDRYLDFEKLAKVLSYNPQEPMLFNTGVFLLLFGGLLLGYPLVYKHARARMLYLGLFSLYFYYKSSGIYLLVLLGSIIFDFSLGIALGNAKKEGLRKVLVVLSVIANLGLLAYFKYINLIIDACNGISEGTIPLRDLFLPAGISFYTFQSLSYTVDVYRRTLQPLRNPLHYGFFVTFFPQLVAGPIVRASEFIPQILRTPTLSKDDFGRALFLIAGGLVKKAIISDYISINFVDRVFDNPILYSGAENLLAVYGYALQIYCDFSGYSDMAIGVALLLGFHLPLNFNAPYQSRSVTEFWRRWHITLSRWLRDYLYIPLGGNRKGKVRTFINLFITMLLGGLWHGASLKFILWGAMHGTALAIERLLGIGNKGGRPWWQQFLGWALTFHFVCWCWMYFRADSVGQAHAMLSRIAFSFHPELMVQWLAGYREVAMLLVLGYMIHFIPSNWRAGLQTGVTRLPLPFQALTLSAVIWTVIQVKSAGITPFIYYQF